MKKQHCTHCGVLRQSITGIICSTCGGRWDITGGNRSLGAIVESLNSVYESLSAQLENLETVVARKLHVEPCEFEGCGKWFDSRVAAEGFVTLDGSTYLCADHAIDAFLEDAVYTDDDRFAMDAPDWPRFLAWIYRAKGSNPRAKLVARQHAKEILATGCVP